MLFLIIKKSLQSSYHILLNLGLRLITPRFFKIITIILWTSNETNLYVIILLQLLQVLKTCVSQVSQLPQVLKHCHYTGSAICCENLALLNKGHGLCYLQMRQEFKVHVNFNVRTIFKTDKLLPVFIYMYPLKILLPTFNFRKGSLHFLSICSVLGSDALTCIILRNDFHFINKEAQQVINPKGEKERQDNHCNVC